MKVFAVDLKPAVIQDALFRGNTALINPGDYSRLFFFFSIQGACKLLFDSQTRREVTVTLLLASWTLD